MGWRELKSFMAESWLRDGRRPMVCLVACAILFTFVSGGDVQALVNPYTADANTVYLYHFNEAAGGGMAANSGSAGVSAYSYTAAAYPGDGIDAAPDTSVLGATGFTGFGNAANLSTANLALGVDQNASGGFSLDDGDPSAATVQSFDALPDHSSILGASDAFTIEAMINVPDTGGLREIISTDSGQANRGFQFRINAGQIEFNWIGSAPGLFMMPLPTMGDHVFAANEWFHVALSYDGTTNRVYWTRVNGSVETANLLGTNAVEMPDSTDEMLLVIGNEGRDVLGTGSSEGLIGLIDEVRISNVARTASQFVFNSGLAACDVDGENGCTIVDFNIIKNNLFNAATMRSQGDLNADNIVNFADFRLWKAGAGAAFAHVTLAGVPEPSAIVLSAVGGCLWVVGSRRSRALRRWLV